MSSVKPIQQGVNESLDHLSDSSMTEVRGRAAPVLNRLATQATDWTHRAVDAMRDGSHRVRQTATKASNSTVSYIKEEPVKAVLMAAAAGAALTVLTRLLSSRNRRD
ncbi:MAG: hypothetical protein KGL90_06345 [Burkholderiales bacterium]|nr:hypothetical protein [Burkholderiales bacterium]